MNSCPRLHANVTARKSTFVFLCKKKGALGAIKALLRRYEGSIKALLRLYEGSMKALLKRYEAAMKALLRLY